MTPLLHIFCGALVLAQLAHLVPLDELTTEFVCQDQSCYSIYWTSRRFLRAKQDCTDIQGNLMTVKNYVEENTITLLMAKMRKDNATVWIGLEQPYKNRCTDVLQPLRGFTWVTGDPHTDYSNWKTDEQKCGVLCVTVRKDGTWEETDCKYKADGYLCEFNYSASCKPLVLPADYNVTYYHTSIGIGHIEGLDFPPDTNAEVTTFGDTLFCADKGDGNGVWSSNTPGAWDCLIENGGCEFECVEKSGTPQCICRSGSELKADFRTCSNSCDPNPCSQLCVPLPDPPGFFCMCSEGYNLTDDGRTCEDIDDCAVKPDICENNCTNTIGSFVCSCKPGFEMVDKECQAIDECDTIICEHVCINYPGYYRCACNNGYVIDENNPNKCKRFCNTSFCEAVECDPKKRETCICPDGYIVHLNVTNHTICTDVDECENDPCEWLCINSFGSYQCICPEGFSLQQTSCIQDEGWNWTEEPSPPSYVRSLQPAMLLGICIAVISMLTVLIAFMCHMLRKHFMEQHALDYKCNNSEQCVVLQYVKTDHWRKL
ncbi:thrombomodulin-like [Mixophyes fleayi]|uniref:thrombomodulin-like n=1 Tax=Mixophyes fleayi TaxID=3061075 RepID=UPI003F4E1545